MHYLPQDFDTELKVTLKLLAAPWLRVKTMKKGQRVLVLSKKGRAHDEHDIKLSLSCVFDTDFLQRMWDVSEQLTQQTLPVEHHRVEMSADTGADETYYENQLKFSLTQLQEQAGAEPENKYQLQMQPIDDGGYTNISAHVAQAPARRRTWAVYLQLGEHCVHRYKSERLLFKSLAKTEWGGLKYGVSDLEVDITHIPPAA
jgi:hypothetical protein